MSEAEVYAGLTEIFHELFGDEAIALTPATNAADIPEWDSLTISILSPLRKSVSASSSARATSRPWRTSATSCA